ncbi:unnamed protein product, partial [Eretmochelys imbricata]
RSTRRRRAAPPTPPLTPPLPLPGGEDQAPGPADELPPGAEGLHRVRAPRAQRVGSAGLRLRPGLRGAGQATCWELGGRGGGPVPAGGAAPRRGEGPPSSPHAALALLPLRVQLHQGPCCPAGRGAARPGPPPTRGPPPAPPPAHNPLLDLRAESFKRGPRQSLTPTHVTARQVVTVGTDARPQTGPCARAALSQQGAPTAGSPGRPWTPPRSSHPRCGAGPRRRTRLWSAPRPWSSRPGPALALPLPPRPLETRLLRKDSPRVPGQRVRDTGGSRAESAGEPPDPASARQTLLDIDMEGQSKDSTVPLCGGALARQQPGRRHVPL